MTDVMISLNSAALSLACREGDVNRVQSLINKYPKGLWYSVVDVCTCLVMGLRLNCLSVKKFLSSGTFQINSTKVCK